MHNLLHNPVMLFIVQTVLIISAARTISLLARKIGQPMVIAEILAGIALGPSLLGVLAPGPFAELFPNSSMPLLHIFSQVGLIFFMFLIGLEMDPKLLTGRGRSSVIISLSSIFVPFSLGGMLALYFYPRLSDPSVPFSSFTLFMGVAMSITAFPVLARIMAERRLMHTRVGAIAIACAAVDDVSAWCMLAFIVCIVRSNNGMGSAVWTTFFALSYILGMILVMRPFLKRVSARIANTSALSQNLVAVVFGLLLISSLITEAIGIHALFGAFLFGAVMPRSGGLTKALAEKLEDFVVVFLLPLFFAYSGLRTQINLLGSWESWGYCVLIIVCACVGKFGGSALAARLTGMRWRDACAIGVLMNTRGLVELIVLNIGLDLHVLSPALFTILVVMALVTTFMTTPLINAFYPQSEFESELAGYPQPVETGKASHAFTMLMCVSHANTGPAMVALAKALVSKHDAENQLYALHLIPPPERTSSYLTEDQSKSSPLIPMLVEGSGAEGLRIQPLSFISNAPDEDICQVARLKKADLILLGMHKPVFTQALLGGIVYKVMQHASSDVGVLIDRGLLSVKRVLFPFSGAPQDIATLRLARRLAELAGVRLTLLQVIQAPEREGSVRIRSMNSIAEVFGTDYKQRERVNLKVIQHADPPEAVIDEARNNYDLVLLSVGQEWGLQESRFSLHQEQIIQRCTSSLLLVRQFGDAAGIEEPAGASAKMVEPERAPLHSATGAG